MGKFVRFGTHRSVFHSLNFPYIQSFTQFASHSITQSLNLDSLKHPMNSPFSQSTTHSYNSIPPSLTEFNLQQYSNIPLNALLNQTYASLKHPLLYHPINYPTFNFPPTQSATQFLTHSLHLLNHQFYTQCN